MRIFKPTKLEYMLKAWQHYIFEAWHSFNAWYGQQIAKNNSNCRPSPTAVLATNKVLSRAGKPMSQNKGTWSALHLEFPFPGSSLCTWIRFGDPQCQISSLPCPLEWAKLSLPTDTEQNSGSSSSLPFLAGCLFPSPWTSICAYQLHQHIATSPSHMEKCFGALCTHSFHLESQKL